MSPKKKSFVQTVPIILLSHLIMTRRPISHEAVESLEAVVSLEPIE